MPADPMAIIAFGAAAVAGGVNDGSWLLRRRRQAPPLRQIVEAAARQRGRLPDVRGRGMLERVFFAPAGVEPGDGAQAAGDGGAGPAAGLQVAGEAFDV